MSIETCGFPTKQAAIIALHGRGCSKKQIATAVNSREACVSNVLWRAGLTRKLRNSITSVIQDRALNNLKLAAAARRITVEALASRILQTVLEDDLIAAVLDDGGGE